MSLLQLGLGVLAALPGQQTVFPVPSIALPRRAAVLAVVATILLVVPVVVQAVAVVAPTALGIYRAAEPHQQVKVMLAVRPPTMAAAAT